MKLAIIPAAALALLLGLARAQAQLLPAAGADSGRIPGWSSPDCSKTPPLYCVGAPTPIDGMLPKTWETPSDPKGSDVKLPDGWTVTYEFLPPPNVGPARIIRKADGSPASPDEVKRALAQAADERRKEPEAAGKKPSAEDPEKEARQRLAKLNKESGGENQGWDPNKSFFPNPPVDNFIAASRRDLSQLDSGSSAGGQGSGGSETPLVRTGADAVTTDAAQRGSIAPAENTFENINVPGMNAIFHGGSKQVNPGYDKKDSLDPGQAPVPWRATAGKRSDP